MKSGRSQGGGGGGALALPVERGRAEAEVAGAGGGGEEGFALVEGHEQQAGLAGFVPEDAFAVDPGGVIAQDPEAARLLRSSTPLRFRRGWCARERAPGSAGPRAGGGDDGLPEQG